MKMPGEVLEHRAGRVNTYKSGADMPRNLPKPRRGASAKSARQSSQTVNRRKAYKVSQPKQTKLPMLFAAPPNAGESITPLLPVGPGLKRRVANGNTVLSLEQAANATKMHPADLRDVWFANYGGIYGPEEIEHGEGRLGHLVKQPSGPDQAGHLRPNQNTLARSIAKSDQ